MDDCLSHLCPYCAGPVPCGAVLQSQNIGFCFSGLTFTLGTLVPLSGFRARRPGPASYWQCLANSFTSIKSLNALSPYFLFRETRLTISAYSCLQNWCLFLKAAIHPFNKHLLRFYLVVRHGDKGWMTGHLPWRSSLSDVGWIKEDDMHIFKNYFSSHH